MKKIVCVSVDEKTCGLFKQYALKTGRSVSSLVEEYMRKLLNKMKKEK